MRLAADLGGDGAARGVEGFVTEAGSEQNRIRIGIDMGGTKIEAIAIDADGRERFRKRVPSPRGDYPGTIEAIVGAGGRRRGRSSGLPRWASGCRAPSLRRRDW
jgi:hypothetical protein